MGKNSMMNNINRMLKVVLDDGREVTGKLLVFDQHMNVVLSDSTETREQTKKMREDGISPSRQLGLILLRGEHVVSVTVLKDTATANSGVSSANFEKAPKAKKSAVKRIREDEVLPTPNSRRLQ